MELSKSTVDRIVGFIGKVKNNKLVEAVYSICTNEGKTVNIVALANNSLIFDERARTELTGNELAELDQLVKESNTQSQDNSPEAIVFEFSDTWNYSLVMMHHREIVAIKTLVSSDILFDKSGKFREMKARAITDYKMTPFSDVFSITNITSENTGEATGISKEIRKES